MLRHFATAGGYGALPAIATQRPETNNSRSCARRLRSSVADSTIRSRRWRSAAIENEQVAAEGQTERERHALASWGADSRHRAFVARQIERRGVLPRLNQRRRRRAHDFFTDHGPSRDGLRVRIEVQGVGDENVVGGSGNCVVVEW